VNVVVSRRANDGDSFTVTLAGQNDGMKRYYLAPATFAFNAIVFAGVAVSRFSSGNFAGAGAMLFASAVTASE